MGLEKVNQVVVSSEVDQVNITGIDTNDVYFLAMRGITSEDDLMQIIPTADIGIIANEYIVVPDKFALQSIGIH